MRALSILSILLFTCGPKNDTVATSDRPSPAGSSSKHVVCFVYHRFNDRRYPSTNISGVDFEAHLKYLTEKNFSILSFSDAMKYLASDEPVKKVAVITIDDGYKSFYTEGLPILRKYKIPATLFINTQTVGSADYMSWDELERSTESKIEIGNHTHSHKFFLNEQEAVRYEDFKKEVNISQETIRQRLGKEPKVFSYPYGEYDAQMLEIVRSMGFLGAAAQNSGVIQSGSDLFACPRFPMSESYARLPDFAEKANMKPLQVRVIGKKSHIISKNQSPQLTLAFEKSTLQVKRLQCFIQGPECKNQVTIENDSIRVTIQPTASLRRRRSLYTLTIPDQQGSWHWFSYLWVIPEIEDR